MSQKYAIVTGASSGVGGAIALELAKSNYFVALVGRNNDRLSTLKKEIGAVGGAVEFSRLF